MKENIKSNKGMTITGLVIYVSSFFMICIVIGIITTFFYNNTKFLSSEATASAEFDILNAYLAKEAQLEENTVQEIDSAGQWIQFSNGNKYIYKDGEEQIYFSNKTTNKYFVIANHVGSGTASDGKVFTKSGDTFTININILNKNYIQKYNLSN